MAIRKIHFVSVFMLIFSSGYISCDATEEQEEVQDEHVCEHLAGGPALSIAASPDMQTALSALAADETYRIQAVLHTRFDIELIQDSTLLYHGIVPYIPIAGTGDYYLYLDKAASVQILNVVDSTVIVPEEVTDQSDYCESVNFKGLYELNAEATYLLSFTDNIDPIIGAVFVAAEDDDDH
jgi:hypothetical protein